jgi:hypothetical protein
MPIKRNIFGISESKHLSHLGVERNCLQHASVVVKRFSTVWFDELERAGENQKQGRKQKVSCDILIKAHASVICRNPFWEHVPKLTKIS